MNKIIEDLRSDLLSRADEKTKLSGERFFREDVSLYGVKTAVVESVARSHFKNIPDKNREYVFALCELLLESGVMEESFVACNWSYSVRSQYKQDDFLIFQNWVEKHVHNWATCDTLCNHSVGTLVEMYPDLVNGLKKWAGSENRWVKRAAAVSLIVPAKRGRFLNDVFEIADILLRDKDDMVQKGYGWMLKVASQAHQEEVFMYVMQNKAAMPRTALRYAIEKMTPEMRRMAMAR
jgi:3-methyladenine DNA glycosylase AlkD